MTFPAESWRHSGSGQRIGQLAGRTGLREPLWYTVNLSFLEPFSGSTGHFWKLFFHDTHVRREGE